MEWTTGMVEYWNGGMEFFKVQYHFLHPNKYRIPLEVSSFSSPQHLYDLKLNTLLLV